MGDIFKTLTAGFSRFVLAWLVPSLATLAVFAVYIYPEIKGSGVIRPIFEIANVGKIQAGLVFSFSAILLSLLFALTALPLNRLLEGYTLPTPIQRHFRRRQVRRMLRFRRTWERTPERFPDRRGQIREQLDLYPLERREILPTRLGNAYKSVEIYGRDQFRLDLQTFNYELHGVASARLLQDVDDTRAQVDFFIGFVGQLSLLSFVSLFVAVHVPSDTALVVAVASLVLARLSYAAAVKNITDLKYAMQALVNTGRPGLATALGYRLPTRLAREREFWGAWTRSVQDRKHAELMSFDNERIQPD
jgi:hypothetical protein